MKKFFAICGHCTTSKREQTAINLITRLRQSWPDSFIAFVSHIPVDKKIQELCNLCFIDDKNPLGNIDFENEHTRHLKQIYWQMPKTGYNLEKTVPYHQYANHRQYHDISIPLLDLYDASAITFFSYDCDPVVANEIEHHYELLQEYDAVFYDFFTPGKSIGTEFFSMSKKAIIEGLQTIKKQDDYFSYGHFTLETIYYALLEEKKLRFKILDCRDEFRFGLTSLSEDDNIEKLSYVNPQHPDVQIVPFIDWTENTIRMLIFMFHHYEQENYEVKITFSDENENTSNEYFASKMPHKSWNLFNPPPGFNIVNVYKNNKKIFKFDLSDKNNFGTMTKS